jgi:hypothetical protein
MAHAPDGGTGDLRERPISELVRDLSQQTSTLVRKEIQLAQAELQQKGKTAGKGAGMLGGAAAAGLLALGALTALKRATPPAPQTVETVKEDIQWAKNPTGSVQR